MAEEIKGKIHPRLIFGTGASAPKSQEHLYNIVKAALCYGIYRYDTAPSYKTEKILGTALRTCMKEMDIKRENLFIQTKIDAWQMQNGNIENFVDKVLCDMGIVYLDSLLVHWPVPEYMDETWYEISKLKEVSKVQKIGVCNVRIRQLYEYEKYDIKPDIIQIERHPLRVCQEEIDYCHANNLSVQCYSPLCKMHPRFRENMVVRDIAEKYRKSVGQVILRWHIDTGVCPIFTSTKLSRIEEYSQIFDFSLSEEEICEISSLNENYKMYLESLAAPGF